MVFLSQKILFAIVCFREKYENCPSFVSLKDSFQKHYKHEILNVFVFDNTDLDQWSIEHHPIENIEIEYQRDKTNPGIAFAYNTIAAKAREKGFKWVVFLDQDTLLPENFYPEYVKFTKSQNEGIAVPKIYSNEKLISPCYYKFYRTSEIREINKLDVLELKNISCINSGLMISIDAFYAAGRYSDKLRLDFCDHEFIERASQKLSSIHVLPVVLHQNFSTDTNSLSSALFRYELFKKDLKTYQQIHSYSPLIFLLVDLPHLLRLSLQYKSLQFIKSRFL